MTVKNIAIIGAGWSGLQISKVLLDSGYNVTVFEALNDVGGTWNPKTAYHGLTIHTPLYKCQFHNFEDYYKHNKLKRLNYIDIFEYCREFATKCGLYQNIRLNNRVMEIHYDSKTFNSKIVVLDTVINETKVFNFDFVINTQFNSPRIPKFLGQDKFKGKIYHTNHIKENIVNEITRNKYNVVLLGASKSATDLAYMFAQRNYNIDWVMRKMYWFFSFDKAYYNHKTGKPASLFYRLLYFFGVIGSVNKFTLNIVFMIWALMGLVKCPGKKHFDFRKCHHGWLDEHQFCTIKNQTNQIYSEISSLEEKSVLLANGSRIDCDILICATGCEVLSESIKLFKNDVEVKYSDIDSIYKYSIIPEFPKLYISGICLQGMGPTPNCIKAAWIMRYIDEDLSEKKLKEISIADMKKYGVSSASLNNAIFDSSDYFFLLAKKQISIVLGSFYNMFEIMRFVYDFSVNYSYNLLPKVEKYLESKKRL